MKYYIFLIFTSSLLFANYAYEYKQDKGKIDMHGGKSIKMTSSSFSDTLKSSPLNDKKNNEKKFIKIENIEKIEEKKDLK